MYMAICSILILYWAVPERSWKRNIYLSRKGLIRSEHEAMLGAGTDDLDVALLSS